MESEIWITPLVMLPGVALLVMSTSIRYGQIHQEFHHFQENDVTPDEAPGMLLRRAVLFRNALVALYVAICLLALASLGGGVASLWEGDAHIPVVGLTAAAVATVAYAAVALVRESLRSLDVIRSHCKTSE